MKITQKILSSNSLLVVSTCLNELNECLIYLDDIVIFFNFAVLISLLLSLRFLLMGYPSLRIFRENFYGSSQVNLRNNYWFSGTRLVNLN